MRRLDNRHSIRVAACLPSLFDGGFAAGLPNARLSDDRPILLSFSAPCGCDLGHLTHPWPACVLCVNPTDATLARAEPALLYSKRLPEHDEPLRGVEHQPTISGLQTDCRR